MCNTSDLADGYILKTLDLNIPTSDIHQCSNALGIFRNRDPNGEGFITNGRGVWFYITALYETTTHTDSYRQVAFHKLSSINFFNKNLDGAMISIVFNKSISDLCDYEYSVRTPEVIYERTFLTILNYLVNPVSYLRCHIKTCERVENK